MIACITSQRLCLSDEVTESEYIINKFEVTPEQWEQLHDPEHSWSMSNSTIYLNQEPFINI